MEGEGLKTLLQTFAGNIFIGILAAASLIFLIKREFVRFVEFAVLAVLIGVLIYQPGVVKGISDAVARAMGS